MEYNLWEGISALTETTVTENETAARYGIGGLEVYATPAMIALMENTSKNCVDLHLPHGFTTVGTEVNIRHLRATPIGAKVKCEACLIKVQGKRLVFKVEVWDEIDKVGEGEHSRYIINLDEFMHRLK